MLDWLQELRYLARRALPTGTSGSVADRLDAKVSSRKGSIKSVQRGTIELAGGQSPGNASATATITAVDTAKSEIHFLGATSSSNITSDGTKAMDRVALTNSTTVTAFAGDGAGGTHIVGYEVVEDN
jgi:hypothetical protein